MKMSLHTRKIQGKTQKTRFISLKNSYHGETCGALSVSDVANYRDAYQEMLFDSVFILPAYVTSTDDPVWNDASEHWQALLPVLKRHADTSTAIIVEPILQGAGGMRMISQDFLSRLAAFAQAHDIHLIADEIMTGLGRTGKMLACDHAQITPDFICLGKGLTSGWLPFSAVLTTEVIYQTFYDDDAKGQPFLHSHTYSGNALGASVALATLEVIDEWRLCKRADDLQNIMREHMHAIADQTGMLINIRGIGAMIAADVVDDLDASSIAYDVCQQAIKFGAFLRPLGNTIYWIPPLTITNETLLELKVITLRALLIVKRGGV